MQRAGHSFPMSEKKRNETTNPILNNLTPEKNNDFIKYFCYYIETC